MEERNEENHTEVMLDLMLCLCFDYKIQSCSCQLNPIVRDSTFAACFSSAGFDLNTRKKGKKTIKNILVNLSYEDYHQLPKLRSPCFSCGSSRLIGRHGPS